MNEEFNKLINKFHAIVFLEEINKGKVVYER